MRHPGLLLALTLGGCPPREPVARDTGDTAGRVPDEAQCDPAIRSVVPTTDATGVYGGDDVVVTFVIPEQGRSTVRVLDGDAAPVPGASTWSGDGRTLRWRPDQPMAPSTRHEIQITYGPCALVARVPFTTSDTGPPVDAAALLQRVYGLHLPSMQLVGPAEFTALLPALLADAKADVLLVSPIAATDGEVTLRWASAVSGDDAVTQDPCSPTTDTPTPYRSPVWRQDGVETTLWVRGAPAALSDATLAGAFSPAGSRIDGVTIAGTLDTRLLDPLVAAEAEFEVYEGATCELLEALQGGGAVCGPCTPDHGVDTCVALDLRRGVAHLQPGLPGLLRVTPEDVAANPACATP